MLHIIFELLFTLQNYELFSQVEDLYYFAKNNLTSKDFEPPNATINEQKQAKRVYEYLFNEKINKRTRFSEFVVHFTTNKEVKKAIENLQYINKPKYNEITNLYDKMMSYFSKELKHNDNFGKELAKELALNQNILFNFIKEFNKLKIEFLTKADRIILNQIKRGKKGLLRSATEDFLNQNFGRARVKHTLATIDNILSKSRKSLFNYLYKDNNKFKNELGNIIKQIIKLPSDKLNFSRVFVNKANAVEIKANNIELSSIATINNELSKPTTITQEIALSESIYETDITSIDFNPKQFYNFIHNKDSYVKDRITWLEKRLRDKFKNHKFYITASKNLANYMITKEPRGLVLQNAFAIAQMANRSLFINDRDFNLYKEPLLNLENSEELSKRNRIRLEQYIDELTSLYALSIASQNEHFKSLKDLPYSDIEKLFNIAKIANYEYQKQSYPIYSNTIYQDEDKYNLKLGYDRTKKIKGAIPIKYNGKMKTVLAHNLKEVKEYEKKGYKLASKINFGFDYKYIMMKQDVSIRSHLSGSMVNNFVNKGVINPITLIGDKKEWLKKEPLLKQEIKISIKETADGVNSKNILPIVSTTRSGKVKSFSYAIPKATQISTLRLESEFSRITGLMNKEKDLAAGYRKNNDKLYQWFRANEKEFLKEPHVLIDDQNDEGYEYFQKLPNNLQKKITKEGSLVVPRILLNEVFGVTIKSTTDYLSKLPYMSWLADETKYKEWFDYLEKIVANFHSINKGEEVIKTPETWIGNLLASYSYVVMEGFQFEDVAKGYINIAKMVQNYHQRQRRINEIKVKYGSNMNDYSTSLKKEVKDILDKNKNDPIYFAMQNGLFESSVEDLIVNADINLGDNIVIDFVNRYKGKVLKGKLLIKFFEELYMSNESASGKISATMLTYGDFIAKMFLFINYTQNMNLSEVDKLKIMNELNEKFINYNVNSSTILEYANKMGYFIYSKFILGMPSSVLKQIGSHPANAGFYYLLEQMFDMDIEMMSDGFKEGMITNRYRSITDVVQDVVTPAYYDLIQRYI